jgi:hypothetical protein
LPCRPGAGDHAGGRTRGAGRYRANDRARLQAATRIDGDFLDKARKSVKRAAARKATTTQGLRAKARAVMVALDDCGSNGAVLDDQALAICKSLTADVERMRADMVKPEGNAADTATQSTD